MAKLKDIIKENFSLVGGVVSMPAIGGGTNTGLTDIVEDIYGQSEKVSAKEIQENMKQFSSFGNKFQAENNISEVAETLSTIASNAKNYTLSETDDWFDKVTVNRNMKELTNLSKQFGKIAKESNSLQQRMSGLYEDMGHVLNRYFEIEGDDAEQEQEKALVKRGLKGADIKEGDYEAFFQKAMEKWGISSPDELDDEKKKKFFNWVDANYSGDNESD